MVKRHLVIATMVLVGTLAPACGSSDEEPAAGTGGAGSMDPQAGGATAAGGASIGGGATTGGATGSGGAAGSAGALMAGGMPGAGGMPPVVCGGTECPIQLPTTCCVGGVCGVEDDLGVCVDPLAGLRDGGTELEPIVPDPACGMVTYTALGNPLELPGCCDMTGVCGGSTADLPEIVPGLSLPTSCLTPEEFASLTFQQPGASTPCGPDAGPAAEAGAAEAGATDLSDASSD